MEKGEREIRVVRKDLSAAPQCAIINSSGEVLDTTGGKPKCLMIDRMENDTRS